jgi:hypothetical protein
MKLLIIAGSWLLIFLGGTTVAAETRAIKANTGQSQANNVDRVMNRMAGQFQGYNPAKNQIRISGMDYELASGIELNPSRLRTNEMVTFEVSGEYVSGREIITNIE